MDKNLVPKESVIRDMAFGDGLVSASARDYYRTHYATEEEKRIMDREDRLITIKAISIYAILIALLLIAIVVK